MPGHIRSGPVMFHLKRRLQSLAATDVTSYVLAGGLYAWLLVFGLTHA